MKALRYAQFAVLGFIVSFTFFWMCGVFVSLEFDPRTWEPGSRAATLTLSMLGGLLSIAIYDCNKDDSEGIM